PASSSRARARGLGSPARPHPRPLPGGAATRARSFARRSSAPAARQRPPPAVHYQEESTSGACLASPASLAAVIVVIVETVSKETGSDLRSLSRLRVTTAVEQNKYSFRLSATDKSSSHCAASSLATSPRPVAKPATSRAS